MNKKQMAKYVHDHTIIEKGRKLLEVFVPEVCAFCIRETQGRKAERKFLDEILVFLVCAKHFQQIQKGVENKDEK